MSNNVRRGLLVLLLAVLATAIVIVSRLRSPTPTITERQAQP